MTDIIQTIQYACICRAVAETVAAVFTLRLARLIIKTYKSVWSSQHDLPAFAAECRRLQHGAPSCPSISRAQGALSSKFAARAAVAAVD